MTAPERMWRSEIGKCPMYPDGGAFYHETMPKEPAEEYIRADLLTAAQAEIARLRAALGKISNSKISAFFVEVNASSGSQRVTHLGTDAYCLASDVKEILQIAGDAIQHHKDTTK